MFIIEFFRDVLDGIWYVLYLILCIMAFFYVLGYVADRKRDAINKKLKEKKTYDIESGREAAIAAMETKQVLDVDDSIGTSENGTTTTVNTNDAAKKEEVPQVMVLNSSEPANNAVATNQPSVQTQNVQPVVQSVNPNASQQVANNDQPKVEEPLVIS